MLHIQPELYRKFLFPESWITVTLFSRSPQRNSHSYSAYSESSYKYPNTKYITPILRSLLWLPVSKTLSCFKQKHIPDCLIHLRSSGLTVPRVQSKHGEAAFNYRSTELGHTVKRLEDLPQFWLSLNQDKKSMLFTACDSTEPIQYSFFPLHVHCLHPEVPSLYFYFNFVHVF